MIFATGRESGNRPLRQIFSGEKQLLPLTMETFRPPGTDDEDYWAAPRSRVVHPSGSRNRCYVMLLRRLVLRSLMQQQQNCHNHMVSVSRGHRAAGAKVTDRGGAMTDISLQETATAVKRSRPFVRGQSRNPAGRPRGSMNRPTRAAQLLLDGEATALSRKAVELALADDPAALRLCLGPHRRAAPRPLGRARSGADQQRGRHPWRDKGGRRRGRARRHHPRRGVRAVADDRKLPARDRRERFRQSLAAIGGRAIGSPSRSLWVYAPRRT